jgi:hypothetical protein
MVSSGRDCFHGALRAGYVDAVTWRQVKPRWLGAAALLTALTAGCASDVPGSVSLPNDPTPLDGVTGELVLTRQRDLLDRGLINARVHNVSAKSLLLSDIRLDADMFDTTPAADRPISVRSGRRVAIQVPYGEVDDCETGVAVTARLEFTYTSDDDPTPREGAVALRGTDLLDSLRAEACVGRRMAESTAITFHEPAVVDGRLETELVIEPEGDVGDLSIQGVAGTVLVAARASDTWSGVDLDGPATIPLTFVVNRCDPHALAEVTKRFGLDLLVTVDGGEHVEVDVDVEPLTELLESIVQQCVDAAAAAD